MAEDTGLGNQAILSKIDKLRELNVGALIPLPQLVVVGDQSSGKSSVLESLTGFSFPRGAGLCTRYVTQITCSRDTNKSVSVSIIPRPDADNALKIELIMFRRCVTEINNNDLTAIFHDANRVMGLRMNATDDTAGLQTFSQDILKIEINGPDQDHFTVIDVPGIFRIASPGLTNESDITLVRNMVKKYMANSRTIILAVMPCNVDIANQEILKLAAKADPTGARTMGVLTKPDLMMEKATQKTVIDLLLGKHHPLKLGYFVVKNRGADDEDSTLAERLESEKAFFMNPLWSPVADRCRIPALKSCARDLLMEISKNGLPHVKLEIETRLRQFRANLDSLGPSRAETNSQRLYLGKLASKFQAVTQSALNGYYVGEPLFKSEPKLKLITRLIKLNEHFSDIFWEKGHQQHFEFSWDHEGETLFGSSESKIEVSSKLKYYVIEYSELSDIIELKDYECPAPSKGPLMDRIKQVYESSRGPEIGTFGGTILAIIFEEQSEKWERLVLDHTSKAIGMVHDYIWSLLNLLNREDRVIQQLWNALTDSLCVSYRRAIDHARFLLRVERQGKPTTYNHYFNSVLRKTRRRRMYEPLNKKAIQIKGYPEQKYVEVQHIGKYADDKSNREQVCEDILDTVVSYYKVSRKRFVDSICQQVIFHFLLDSDDGPLNSFSPEFVMNLEPDQLEMIAGEDSESKRQRQVLDREISSLETAVKFLRMG